MVENKDQIMKDASPDLTHLLSPQEVSIDKEDTKKDDEKDKEVNKSKDKDEEDEFQKGSVQDHLALLPSFMETMIAITGNLVTNTSDIAEAMKNYQELTNKEYVC